MSDIIAECEAVADAGAALEKAEQAVSILEAAWEESRHFRDEKKRRFLVCVQALNERIAKIPTVQEYISDRVFDGKRPLTADRLAIHRTNPTSE
jgi:hypothetical protein